MKRYWNKTDTTRSVAEFAPEDNNFVLINFPTDPLQLLDYFKQ